MIPPMQAPQRLGRGDRMVSGPSGQTLKYSIFSRCVRSTAADCNSCLWTFSIRCADPTDYFDNHKPLQSVWMLLDSIRSRLSPRCNVLSIIP